jgi:hypothetical protein
MADNPTVVASTPMLDPLSDPVKSKVYFDMSRGPGDPEAQAVRSEVAAYFASIATPEVEDAASGLHRSATVPMSSTVEELLPPEETDDQHYDVIADLAKDGYVGLVPEYAAEIAPRLAEKAASYQGKGLEPYLSMAKDLGESEAADALIELQTIGAGNKRWMDNPALRKRVIALNKLVDAATLRIASQL